MGWPVTTTATGTRAGREDPHGLATTTTTTITTTTTTTVAVVAVVVVVFSRAGDLRLLVCTCREDMITLWGS